MPNPFPVSWQRLVCVAALGLLLSACTPEPAQPAFQGSNIAGSHFGQDMEMVDTSGQTRRLDDYRGKVLVVFFGFTHCPDVCPTSLAQLHAAQQLLGQDAEKMQAIMISVDPQRDTPALLRTYLDAFSPDFVGLTGSADQLARTARSFKAFYARSGAAGSAHYSMDHSSSFYVIDQTGQARSLLRGDATPEEIAHDVRLLLD
ncbi:SCO family protein [Alcaligenes sp. SDU_A2]|uniref:SCO family protein n=1 Tax=Alcaligenes sp. SDU_A2 TaxID=3136634 RepID=UPI002C09F508|nr:SCO family protein [Alcaligenes sp.]HRL27019.1 SCO family protein [Alcaligenes sp.]